MALIQVATGRWQHHVAVKGRHITINNNNNNNNNNNKGQGIVLIRINQLR